MANKSKIEDEAAGLVGAAREAADVTYAGAKRVYEHADEKIDELSKFGKQRPLLAMGISFALGYLIARILPR